MSDETTLLPCPFCGKDDKLAMHHRKTRHYDEPLAAVKCKRCGIRGRYQMTDERAVTAWNTRAERTCRQEERGWGTEGDHARVWLTCGHDCMVHTVQDLPNFCPTCGARVVGGDA